MCAALSPTPPTSSTNSSISTSDHQTIDNKNGSIDSTNNLPQPAFLRSFEAELDKVDEYFQKKAPDVRQAILNKFTTNVPTPEQLNDLKVTRDALKVEYDSLRQSIIHQMSTETKLVGETPNSDDLEKTHRLPSESRKQWELRKKFLERYWNQYDQERLLCLAR
ncbi:hypothetical protein I4U23_021218 [Adineta vaga]|nr:hypothetical protein I4U23_021218 [Adineta vaga]